ncbi:uncharacterized protein [Rutidosis leptorrhynchoides]|uniref:uncharacterized protein n=1 Tax=Rutidosis leptorrhynchoides TaxID=125765 RepID=UPI003A9928EE
MTLKPSKMHPVETPIKIGTKGTVGSLMMKELEYFNRLEVQSHTNTLQVLEAAAKSQPESKIENKVTINSKSKKRSNKFIPSICSAIDVANNNGPKTISGFSYKTLKADARRSQV